MTTLTVSAIYIYPIKGCAGIELTGVRFDACGPQFDRRYMLIDPDGQMVTQRQVPELALISPGLLPTHLVINAGGMQELKLSLSQYEGSRRRAVVWDHEAEALDQGDHAAQWFSEVLKRPVRLVRWADDQIRPVSKMYTHRDAQTAFSDGYPVLLTSEASLADLNKRLATPVRMERFRPNIVVTGCEAYAEDSWKEITIEDLGMDVVKPCGRCQVINVDPLTGHAGQEPLKTLASYRTQNNRVVFGQNCIHHGYGNIRVGDQVHVVTRQPSAP